MFYNQHGVSFVDEFPQNTEEPPDVVKVQAGRWFVQNVKSPAGPAARKLGRQFYPLGFAAGKSRGRLSKFNVAQTHFKKRCQFLMKSRNLFKKFHSVLNRHLQDLGDVLSFIFDFQGLLIITAAAAFFAFNVDVGQKVHFNFFQPLAFAMFAPAAFDVKAESSGAVTANLRFVAFGEKIADDGKNSGVSRRI